MSIYTPYFPPQPPLSTCSSTSSSGSYKPSKLSYSVRLSRSHLALASLSNYISPPPSPSSNAVNTERVSYLRNKFRRAVDATYRDTSSGKWVHVSELAKLGSTRGRWHGVCSGNTDHHNPDERNNQVVPGQGADPYPRPPDPLFDPQQARDNIEKWQASILSPSLSQADGQCSDTEQPLPPHLPTTKRRSKGVVRKTIKSRQKLSLKDVSTSRYFRQVVHVELPKGTNCDNESPSSLRRGSNGLCAPVVTLDDDRRSEPILSPTPVIPSSIENIGQVSELFLPPSFPSHLRTSTPPLLSTTENAHPLLTKPPVIPRTDGLYLSVSLPSPLPFPRSQVTNRVPGSEPSLNGTPPPSTRKRSLRDIPSPAESSRPMNRCRRQSLSSEKPTSTPKSSLVLDCDALKPDLDVSPGHVPVIDLRQLASSQRSRAQSRHCINPITPRKDKGKSRVTMSEMSPLQRNVSRSLAPPDPLIPPPFLPHFSQDGNVFAPAATSTQPPLAKCLPSVDSGEFVPSHSSQFDVEAQLNDILDHDVDLAPWVRDVPIVEGKLLGVPERAPQLHNFGRDGAGK